jgi:thiol:disulfide interchange protein DsbD
MRIGTSLLITLLLLLSFFTYSQPQLFGSKNSKTNEHHTKVSLLADVKTIQPGVPFTVGVLMKMDEGWHTYWKNAGEAGLPTEIKWKLPEGFTTGEIRWPLPHKYNESGDVLTYGYETENMLLVQITPPNSLTPSATVIVKAEVSWLECEKLCVPGDESAALKMTIAASFPEQNNVELFGKYRKQIPQPFVANSDFSLTSETKNGRVKLHLDNTGTKQFVVRTDIVPDFYPESIGELTIGRTHVAADAAKALLQIPLSAFEKVAGPFTLHGVLLYQLEGEERKAVTIEVPLSKEFCAAIPISGSEGALSQQATGSILDQKFHTIETGQARQPLYMYVLFAIIGGLLLNIMPCVLPVIALKIFGLVKMAGDEPREAKKLGWFFSLGILASFLSLALLVVILKSAGESVGWGFQFQEPLFVIAMSTIVFAFGLSLFGVYEINLPGFAVAGASTVATKAEAKKGFLAPFSEGVFATILATPCTAPILGTALGFAFAQPAHVTLLIFTATAFGMALPYLILTTKPAWMKFLPKPGEWMVAAKQFMGFLMMATVVWLLYILGKQLGMEAVIWTSAFLLFVGVACWVIGTFATLTATRVKYVGTWAVALLLVVAGYKLFIGDVLEARDVLSNTALANPSSSSSESEGITWQPFSLEQLESHLKENKTVFIDFTAEWCLTCKVNEKTVLADQQVINKLKENNIVAMKADWTNRNETITRLLAKFGRSGVPLYVVFPAGKPTEPIVLPEVITTSIVLEALAKATDA